MAYSFDINMLRMMKKRGQYQKYRPQINSGVVTEGTLALIKDFGRYFDKFPDHKEVDFQLFIPRFHAWNKAVSEEVMATRVAAIRAAAKGDIAPDVEAELQREIANVALANALAEAGDAYAEGDLPDLGGRVQGLVDSYRKNAGVASDTFIDTPIGELLNEDNDEEGYLFRLNCLQLSMRGCRPGDSIIVAGRPDKGKTTFLASEATYMAQQLPDHRNILWLNNEGPGRRIIPRLYQAALGITRSEMVSMHEAGTLEKAYADAVGRPDRIRIKDIHGMTAGKVEQIIEAHDAEIVIYDMIDNIKFPADGAARTDEKLEQMYQWARECAVKYHHVEIATSQISADGAGEMHPPDHMLKDSKTGKQGACDAIIMIGHSNDPTMDRMRGIGIPKNKLRREGQRGDPRATVVMNAEIARYEDDFPEE